MALFSTRFSMARLPRLSPIDVPVHVLQRGNNRQTVFRGDDDYAFYLDTLRMAAQMALPINPKKKPRSRIARMDGESSTYFIPVCIAIPMPSGGSAGADTWRLQMHSTMMRPI